MPATIPPRYLHLSLDADLPALQLPPFTAIVLVEDEVAQSWMWEAARWLVASGARVVLAWGRDCAAWAEAVDEALDEAFDYSDVPPERQVATTAFADDDLDEVFWFARHRATHPALQLDTTLIVHVAPAARKDELEAQFMQA